MTNVKSLVNGKSVEPTGLLIDHIGHPNEKTISHHTCGVGSLINSIETNILYKSPQDEKFIFNRFVNALFTFVVMNRPEVSRDILSGLWKQFFTIEPHALMSMNAIRSSFFKNHSSILSCLRFK